MQNEDEKPEVENPGEDADRWQELKRPPSKDASLADKIKWLVTTIIVIASAAFVIFGLTGCATPRAAVAAETEALVTIQFLSRQIQAEDAAKNHALVTGEGNFRNLKEIRQELDIEYANKMNRATSPAQGAAIEAEYRKSLDKAVASAQAELDRLNGTGQKAIAIEAYAEALRSMSTSREESNARRFALLKEEVLPFAIGVAEQVKAAVDAKEEERIAKLAREAAEDAAKPPHHEEPPPPPATPAPPTNPSTPETE